MLFLGLFEGLFSTKSRIMILSSALNIIKYGWINLHHLLTKESKNALLIGEAIAVSKDTFFVMQRRLHLSVASGEN